MATTFLAGVSGCTRHFFRKCADQEVGEVLAEKDRDPNWRIEQWYVYPHPRSRFADPTNPDRPPMPPDDPAAWDLSPHPQKPGKEGSARVEGTGYLDLLAEWDAENRAEAAAQTPREGTQKQKLGAPSQEKPQEEPEKKVDSGPGRAGQPAGEAKQTPEDQKQAAAPPLAASATALSRKPKPGERPPYLLKLEQAVELGLINSREYQAAREDLYLTALPVTLERFAFAAQFFAVEQAVRNWAGSRTAEGHQSDWRLNSNAGFTKLFSTGALLLFNFANQTVFNLTGRGRDVTSQSTINLDLVQPLLRGGGRAVTLEPLTQTERNLVYGIRNFARFRKEFYVAIAGGGGGSITGAEFQPTGVIASPTFTPSAGFGASGLVPGVVPAVPASGTVGLQVNPGLSGRNALQVPLAAPVSGYLSTLLQAAQIRVDEYNIEKLAYFLDLGKALQEGGDIAQLQVDQFEQQLLRGRTSLLTDQQQYLQALDQFKLQLGLPTELFIELDDTPFRPLNEHFQRYENFFKEFNAATVEASRFGTPEMLARVRGELRRIFTTSALVKGTRFQKEILGDWSAWEKLSANELQKQLAGYREERRRLQERQTELEAKGLALSAAEQQRLSRLNFEIDLGAFESTLRDYESQPWNKVTEPELRRQQQQARYRALVNAFVLVLAEARTERLEQLRRQWPDLARLCVGGVDLLKADLDEAETAVVQSALLNRLDLMNVRAQVVDAWRQIAVFANSLLGTFNVQYHMDSTTPAGLAQPLAFSGSRTRHQLFFNTELPLVRMQERNNYRASLINYQRARRILMGAEDRVAYDVRGEVRLLREQEENYKIQERQVELAYMTVENSLDTFQAPPQVAGQQADTQTRAAALTTQLINAQTSLYNAQFQMTTIWITYLNTRLQLYRDLELMPLDNRGVWIDDIATCQCSPAVPDRSAGIGYPNLSGSGRLQREDSGLPEKLPAAGSPALEEQH
jgi:outer membrane protein TolC